MRISFVYLCLLFVSCAGKEIVVRNADTLLEYQVQKRIPLNDKQKQNLQRDIDAFLNKEKVIAQEMLPVIDEIDLNHPDQIEGPYKKFEGLYRRISLDFSTLLSKHLAVLSPSQQEELFRNLEEENRRMKEQTQEERREAATDRLERFIGDLSREQEKIIKSYDSFYKRQTEERLHRRRELHREFKQILARETPAKDKEEALVKAYLTHQDTNFANSKALEIVKKIIPTLTKKQKENFRKKSQEIKELLQFFVQSNY